MEFTKLKKQLQENFAAITEGVDKIFEVSVDKDEMWNLYLDSFPAGTNEIYRERREYDCSCCRQFVKNIGNAVVIKNNKMITIWDFETNDAKFQPVLNAMSAYIKSKRVSDIYISKEKTVGTDRNFENTGKNIIEWDHFFLALPDKYVDRSSRSEGDIKGSYRDERNVFKRSLDEMTGESVLTILELIAQNSLYKGEEWQGVLIKFNEYKKAYDKLSDLTEKENFAWEWSVIAGVAVSKIRNHSIGTLLTNISEGMELDTAVKKYEAIVAPSNYKRPKAIFTQKMLDEAKKTIEDLGYLDSLGRRYATLDDITVNNILFSNKDAAKRIAGSVDIFDDLSKSVNNTAKKFSKVEEISVDAFVNDVLPTVKELEILFENKHSKNMVSLIAPENRDSKSMFKWNNGFSWGYTGNITDSDMKENVKKAGGQVDGVLRFSIQWNDGSTHNHNDLDAHCIEPNGNRIYFGDARNYNTTGVLDVDITQPQPGVPAVENITWSDRTRMLEGKYKFFVNVYADRGGKGGFKAEIEFDGQIYSFEYDGTIRNGGDVMVAEVEFSKSTGFTIKELLPSTTSTKELWNVNTNDFVPVSVVMYSPNYWDEQDGIGHRHYFFMIKDCVNSESPNGFYNEFLKNDLDKHKRVFEALGSKMSVKDVDDQLSGVGFSSTKRNELIVKAKGNTERVLKIKF